MITGSCLCGRIRYEADTLAGPVGHCHCRTCRKAHGAAFSTTARAERTAFRFTAGEDGLRAFESSPGKKRYFCGTCGSHLFAAWDDAPHVILRIGTVDDASPMPQPAAHIHTAEKAPWFEITDELPAFPGAPQARTP